QLAGQLPASGGLRRSHPQRREARRHAGASAYQVRACYQPQDGESTRDRSTTDIFRPRRRGDRMRARRDFITLVCGAAARALAARAQQAAKLPTIGFLGGTTPETWSRFVAAFVQRLRELGWIEGRTIAIEYRWAEGRGERFAEIAAEFVRLKVDVIVTVGGAVLAAKQATSL